jgi:hypothetical protein
MNRLSIALVTAVSLISFAGCKDKKSDGGGASAGKAAEGKGAALKLPKLNLQIDVAGESNVGDAIMGEGNMIQGESIGAMQVEIMKTPKPLEEEKSDAEMFTPKNLKAEALPDGWVVTFDNKGSMGANYFVNVRRDIGGKSYKCSTTGSNADQAKAVLAACKSLRP